MAQIIEKPLEFQEKECIINSNKLDIGGSMEFDFVITGIKRVIKLRLSLNISRSSFFRMSV